MAECVKIWIWPAESEKNCMYLYYLHFFQFILLIIIIFISESKVESNIQQAQT